MENVCGGAKPYLNSAHLETEHLRVKTKAIDQFTNKRKMGGEEFSETYKIKLEAVSAIIPIPYHWFTEVNLLRK